MKEWVGNKTSLTVRTVEAPRDTPSEHGAREALFSLLFNAKSSLVGS